MDLGKGQTPGEPAEFAEVDPPSPALTSEAIVKDIRIGVGGWTFPPWRETFFPKGLCQADELSFSARTFPTLEVNGTYYRTQTPETFSRWAAEVPDDFIFALKAPRYATSRKILAEAGPSVDRFLASGLDQLGARLGPINWQLPPTKAFDADDLAAFLALLPDTLHGLPLRHAIEARHASFADPAFADLLKPRGIAAVHAADSEYPEIDIATAPFAYLRIMGTTEDTPLGYKPKALDAWADRIRQIAETREVWLFVISGHKAANPAAAQALLERLQLS